MRMSTPVADNLDGVIASAAAAAEVVVVRPLEARDSIAELTGLLHRAYRGQVEMGLRPLAGRQSEEVTRRRTASGECFVAAAGDRLVGTILLQEKEEASFPGHFLKPGVAHFSLFAVDSQWQSRGIGRLLLATIGQRCAELGFAELACSMAEPDTKLMGFYLRQGFVFVEHWQWPYTNYRSAILSKVLR